MKTFAAIVALTALAWWLQQQIAISRTDEPSTLQLLKNVLKKEAA